MSRYLPDCATLLMVLLMLVIIWGAIGMIEERDEIILVLQQRIADQAEVIRRDDKILNKMMHGTWDRSCEYELIPGELLADGSIRESLIQHCDPKK